MAAGTQSTPEKEEEADPETRRTPDVTVCESRPGTVVFIESRNTDGWLSTDTVVDVTR